MSPLEDRLRELYRGDAEEMTADDVTLCGQLTVDGSHEPNARQNSIGALIQREVKAGHLADTGRAIRSAAPHRKGGRISVWRITPAARRSVG